MDEACPVTPLIHNLAKLSHDPHHRFSLSLHSTPLVRPSAIAFHSTGLLQKRNKRMPVQSTPETPVKKGYLAASHPFPQSRLFATPVKSTGWTPAQANWDPKASRSSSNCPATPAPPERFIQNRQLLNSANSSHLPMIPKGGLNNTIASDATRSGLMEEDLQRSQNTFPDLNPVLTPLKPRNQTSTSIKSLQNSSSTPLNTRGFSRAPYSQVMVDPSITEQKECIYNSPVRMSHGSIPCWKPGDSDSLEPLTTKKKNYRSPLKDSPKFNKRIHLNEVSPPPLKTPSKQLYTPSKHLQSYRSPGMDLDSENDPEELSTGRLRTISFDSDFTRPIASSSQIYQFSQPFPPSRIPLSTRTIQRTLPKIQESLERHAPAPYPPVKMQSEGFHQHIPYIVLFSRNLLYLDTTFFKAIDGDLDSIQFLTNQSTVQEMHTQNHFESNFHILEKIGQGEFGEVFRVARTVDGREFALKITSKPFLGYKDAIQKIEEVKSLVNIGASPYIVELASAWVQSGLVYILMELCTGGKYLDLISLSDFLDVYYREYDTPLPETRVWKILGDGLRLIHQKSIVHRDIKPSNLFLTKDLAVKIGDFGLATALPITGGDREGDRTYLAPEILNMHTVGFSADIFSLGLILLEMCAGVDLPENGLVWQHLREGMVDDMLPEYISQPLADLIKSMLQPDPNFRPSAFALLQHPLLASLLSISLEPALLCSHSSLLSV